MTVLSAIITISSSVLASYFIKVISLLDWLESCIQLLFSKIQKIVQNIKENGILLIDADDNATRISNLLAFTIYCGAIILEYIRMEEYVEFLYGSAPIKFDWPIIINIQHSVLFTLMFVALATFIADRTVKAFEDKSKLAYPLGLLLFLFACLAGYVSYEMYAKISTEITTGGIILSFSVSFILPIAVALTFNPFKSVLIAVCYFYGKLLEGFFKSTLLIISYSNKLIGWVASPMSFLIDLLLNSKLQDSKYIKPIIDSLTRVKKDIEKESVFSH